MAEGPLLAAYPHHAGCTAPASCTHCRQHKIARHTIARQLRKVLNQGPAKAYAKLILAKDWQITCVESVATEPTHEVASRQQQHSNKPAYGTWVQPFETNCPPEHSSALVAPGPAVVEPSGQAVHPLGAAPAGPETGPGPAAGPGLLSGSKTPLSLE